MGILGPNFEKTERDKSAAVKKMAEGSCKTLGTARELKQKLVRVSVTEIITHIIHAQKHHHKYCLVSCYEVLRINQTANVAPSTLLHQVHNSHNFVLLCTISSTGGSSRCLEDRVVLTL